MKKVCCLILLFLTGISFSQIEEGNYAAAASRFMAFYNAGDYGGIFTMFDADMKKALPRQRTIDFFTQNVSGRMGNIQAMQFLELRQGAHIYRTRFDHASADVLISLNPNNEINGFYITPPKPADIPILERNQTRMALPFNEEWYVFWGGTIVDQNYHVEEVSQQYAYDFLVVKDGASYEGDAGKNENYFAFGRDIVAPCDARVVKVISGVEDNIPGVTNPEELTGNTIVLETPNGEFILFAHLREGSIVVQEGQDISKGTRMGQCGNSGNSTEAHLHLSLQNAMDMESSTGAKLFFEEIWVNGELRKDYLPVKGEVIRNVN